MYQGEENQETTQSTSNSLLGKLKACLHLASLMPPSKLRKNVIGLTSLAPDLAANLLEKIMLPLEIDTTDENHPFLKTEFNRDGDNYRSPFTNIYYPDNEAGYYPGGKWRELEQMGGLLFGEYIKLYYNEGLFSFYVLENEGDHEPGRENFSCGFFVKKGSNDEGSQVNWDSYNIVDVSFEGHQINYKLETIILLELGIQEAGTNLTSYMTKSNSRMTPIPSPAEQIQHHLATIGQLIEENESSLRQYLESVYVIRTKEALFTTRYEHGLQAEQQKRELAEGLKNIRFGKNE